MISGNKNKGFTLIELLGTIAVLVVVFTVVVYCALNIINSTKELSYKVTINNIEDDASNYVLEEMISLKWDVSVNGDYEYQCVTVQNLIDAGYFKSDVLESDVSSDRKVLATDSVYLERDITTKNIVKSVLLLDDRYSGLCVDSNVVGNIDFGVSPSGWAKSKNVEIKYNIYNLMDSSDLSKYSYNYSYDNVNLVNNFNDLEEIEDIYLSDNTVIYANIYDKDGDVISSSNLLVDKIDNIIPYGEIISTNNVDSQQEVTLKINDDESGLFAYYFGMDNPNDSDVEWIKVENTDSKIITTDVFDSGRYYLGIKDVVGNVNVISKSFYKTMLVVSNATVDDDNIITMEGNSFDVPIAVPYEMYSFVGWYNNSSYTGNKITTYKPFNDSSLYGLTEKSEFYVNIKYNINGGNVTPVTGFNNWTTTDGMVYLNGGLFVDKVLYGFSLNNDGLVNWDNSKYLEISRAGYHALDNEEWVCLSGECVGKTYSDSISYSASDFCDASNSDCEVVLGVNWKGNTYRISYILDGGYSQIANSNGRYCSSNYSVGGNHDVWKLEEGVKKSVDDVIVQMCVYGENCKLTIDVYERQCNIFKGWTTRTDVYSVNYTDVNFGESDSDDFYTYADEFVYNYTSDIVLHAVWKDNHNWEGIGNQLHSTSKMFTCGNFHTSHGGYAVYCTKCQMAAAHYNRCYRLGYDESVAGVMHCPCNPGYQVAYDDNAVLNSGGEKLGLFDTTNLRKFGGIIEGQSLNVATSQEKFVKVCNDHYAHTVTLDKQGGSEGTSVLYASFGKGLYLNFSGGKNGTGKYSNQITTSKKLTVPKRSGYTFMGYYTGVNGSGKEIITKDGYLASDFSSSFLQDSLIFNMYGTRQIIITRNQSYNKNVTLYAYWK